MSEKSQLLMIRKQPGSERLIMLKLQSFDIFAIVKLLNFLDFLQEQKKKKEKITFMPCKFDLFTSCLIKSFELLLAESLLLLSY